MIYAAAVAAAIILIGGILFLLGRGAERRERERRHRRGIRAGDGVEGGAGSGVVFDSWSTNASVASDSGNWDSGSSGSWDSGKSSSCDSGSSGDSGGDAGSGCD